MHCTKHNFSRKFIAASSVAMGVAIGAGVPMTASAQDDGSAAQDEIVVTAQFREQNLQDTPIAITAVTGDMMEARSQTSLFEIANQAPSVTLR